MISKSTAIKFAVVFFVGVAVARCGASDPTPITKTVVKHDVRTVKVPEVVLHKPALSPECLDLLKYTSIAYEDDRQLSTYLGKIRDQIDHNARDVVAGSIKQINRDIWKTQHLKTKLDNILLDRTGAQQSFDRIYQKCEAVPHE